MKSVARPYARALFAVAGSLDKASQVRDELALFARQLTEVPVLREALANPSLAVDAKRRAAQSVAQRQGLDALTARLLGALVSRHRLAQLDEIVAGLGELIDERRGVAVAEVQSAEPLSDEEQRQLQQALEKQVGKRLQMRVEVAPELLAGFVARVDSQLFDGSLRGQLDRLARELATT